ncbi:BTAD domain-containing putative transcriptional regulator [Arthrobacter sp. Cr_A7]|uniref:BTAD domain-containing putative transcriptional regulator n=1 Tax=Arthrobacter sp. Cr_A7 TaxID=3031017 RepID=UPI0023DB3DD9|nr:BTAD domain-containing putative transcriptional regulator [Arthrobacter sp. Cr_A7]MDF2048438.1 BTAD domain-containing putative transcriptional regulator [Arthrobacter sp. Cr_A7]
MTILEMAKKSGGPELVPASQQAPVLTISVFGPLTIRRGNTELGANDLGGPKPRQVLEILLLNFGSAVSKTRIMDLLWGDNHPSVALPTLESYVSVLRRHLQPGSGRGGPLRTVTGGYAIDRSLVDLDLNRFDTLTKQASQADAPAALALLTEALEIASAPLLGDELLPAWAEEERALHAARVSMVRVQAAETALAVGDVAKAITWGGAAAKEDPLNERAWTALILGLERNGEKTEALRAYDRCRKVLDEELGCAPSPALKEAHARLLTSTAAALGPAETRSPIHVVSGAGAIAPAVTKQETERVRILIVDDHTTFSDLLAGALDREPDLKSVGAAKSVESAVTMFRELRPDVVLMDLHLTDGSGLEAAGQILSEAPGARVIMLTGNPSQEALGEAARMGICGFLPKDGGLGVMLDTLRHAHPGNMIVHPSLFAGLVGAA